MLNDTRGRLKASPGKKPGADRWNKARAAIFGALMTVVISAVLLIDFLPSNRVILNAGNVATENILAPYDLTYESEIRSKQAKEEAAGAVQNIFDPPDPLVAKEQEVRAATDPTVSWLGEGRSLRHA